MASNQIELSESGNARPTMRAWKTKRLAPSFNGDGNNADPILLDEDTGAIMIDD
jgi:hypothetical protein